MTPNCCVCGRFTTFLMIRTPATPNGGPDDYWYCKDHAKDAL